MSPARAVRRAQHALAAVYKLDLEVNAWDHLVTASQARELLTSQSPRSGLLAIDEGDELFLGLYLDPSDAEDPHTIVEETSHFVCLAWHALQGRPISALLLELQSEVDRYALARLDGRDGLAHFTGFRWDSWLDGETRERYEVAHRAGYRYCTELERRFPKRRHVPALLSELRRFYRAPAETKLCQASA